MNRRLSRGGDAIRSGAVAGRRSFHLYTVRATRNGLEVCHVGSDESTVRGLSSALSAPLGDPGGRRIPVTARASPVAPHSCRPGPLNPLRETRADPMAREPNVYVLSLAVDPLAS